MNQDIYHRQQETRQQQERLSGSAGKHTTMEFVQIEQDTADLGQTPEGAFDTAPPAPTLWVRVKRVFIRK